MTLNFISRGMFADSSRDRGGNASNSSNAATAGSSSLNSASSSGLDYRSRFNNFGSSSSAAAAAAGPLPGPSSASGASSSSLRQQDFNVPVIRVNNMPLSDFGGPPIGRRRRPRSRGLHTDMPYGGPSREDRFAGAGPGGPGAAGSPAAGYGRGQDGPEAPTPPSFFSNSIRSQVWIYAFFGGG